MAENEGVKADLEYEAEKAEIQAQQIKDIWNLYNGSVNSNNGGEGSDKEPPFVFVNPAMYSEQYREKMKNLQKKKEQKERKTQKKATKNVKSSFVTNKDEDYDIDQVLKQLGETSIKDNITTTSSTKKSSKS
jgi:predicted small secreted protein